MKSMLMLLCSVVLMSPLSVTSAIAESAVPISIVVPVVQQISIPVLVNVEVNGKVSDAAIIRTSSSNKLDWLEPAIIEAVKQWRFKPELDEHNKPRQSVVTVYFTYRLDLAHSLHPSQDSLARSPWGLPR